MRGGYLRSNQRADGVIVPKSGRVDVHRWLFVIGFGNGPGPHHCDHCEWPVRVDLRAVKLIPEGEERDSRLVVDHLDTNKLNLSEENLVASCWWCNRVRHKATSRGQDLARWAGTAPSERPRLWQNGPDSDVEPTETGGSGVADLVAAATQPAPEPVERPRKWRRR